MEELNFNKDVIRFRLGEIEIIGNRQNGSYCGLSKEGSRFIDMIENNEKIGVATKFANRQLLSYLKEANYFDNTVDKNKIISAYLHITNRCNLRCIGCYSEDCTRNNSADLTIDQEKIILDKLKELGVKFLIISGGETLLRDDLAEIARYAKENCNVEYLCVLSNGLLLKEDTAKKLSGVVDEYSISIDSYDGDSIAYIRRENRFDDLMAAVEIAKKYFKKVNILPTIHRKNVDELDNFIILAKKLNVDISFSILTCGQSGETADLMVV